MRLSILIPAIALAACSGSGNGQQTAASTGTGPARSYDVSGFDKVALEGSSDVVIRTGLAASVRAEGDPKVLDRLEISVRGSTLTIGHKRKGGLDFSVSKGATVFVTLPVLAEAAIGGAGEMQIDGVEGQEFRGEISGSGDMKIESLRVGSARFSIAGNGDVEAAGAAERLALDIAGSGDLDLERVESRTLSVSIAGSGDVKARATDTADVSILGSGDVTVAGPAKCSVSKLGSGTVRCNA